jgi:uncharacterized membrane protein YfcA
MLFGLPAAEANGTNRLGIVLGTVGSVAGFWRKGHVYPGLTWQVGFPGLLGSLVGSWIGVTLPDPLFKPILAAIILFVVIETARPRKKYDRVPGNADEPPFLRSGFWPFLAYAGIGFYGGFIQAGVGLIMMYVFSRLGNLNLIQSNALKVSDTLIFVSLSLVIYSAMGKVKWDMAVVLALGNALGGYAGSVFQVRKGEGFVRIFLVVSGLALAAKLIFDAIWTIF